MFTKSSLTRNWLWTAIIAAFLMGAANSAQAGGLDDSIPMSPQSWSDVRTYMQNVNRSYSPSPGVSFRHPQPRVVISERTAVEVLDSVVDSMEEGGKNFEPWIFQFINMSCGLPCDGT